MMTGAPWNCQGWGNRYKGYVTNGVRPIQYPAMHRRALAGLVAGTLLVTGCAARQAVPRPFPGAPAPPVEQPAGTTLPPAGDAAPPPAGTVSPPSATTAETIDPAVAATAMSAPWVP